MSNDDKDERVSTKQVGQQVKTIQAVLSKMNRRDEKVKLETLIPGSKRDVIVLARRSRLEMVQIMYNRNVLDLKGALQALKGNLTQNNDDTFYDDSKLLTIRPEDKENNDANEEENSKE